MCVCSTPGADMLKFGDTGDDSDGDQALPLTDPAPALNKKKSKRKPLLNKSEAGSGQLAAESGCWDARRPITPTMLDDRASVALLEVAAVETTASRHGHRRAADCIRAA